MGAELISEAVITAQEAWDHIFKDTGNRSPDELDALTRIVNGVSQAIEQYILGPVRTRGFDQTYDGGTERIFVRCRPVVSVANVTEAGRPVPSNGYYVYKAEGILRRAGTRWLDQPQAVQISYTAGLAATVQDVPADIKMAALIWCHDIWSSGPANFSNVITEGGSVIRPQKIPAPVAQILGPYRTLWVGAV